MEARWIWLSDGLSNENERGCFATQFQVLDRKKEIVLSICADTKYIVYLNGEEIGEGPIRSGKDTAYYDNYEVTSLVRSGINYLAIRVWNYGWSTYQSLAGNGGLIFTVEQENHTLICSSNKVRCKRDHGHKSNAPKRNVNLGFTDYYDATLSDLEWIKDSALTQSWSNSTEIQAPKKELRPRTIRPFHWVNQYPHQVLRIQDVHKGCQQVTVNTRKAFFGDRADADETIFAGFIGCVIDVPEAMEGQISFPNRTWNGILGDFRIDERLYEVSNQNRDIPVTLREGKQLFLLQVSGKYDDLFCHLEFCFPKELTFCDFGMDRKFFVIGPTDRIIPIIDGFEKVYGGLDEFNRMVEHTEVHKTIFNCGSLEELMIQQVPLTWIDSKYVFYDEYFLSLTRKEQVCKEYAVLPKHLGMLWNNQEVTVIDPVQEGDYRRIIVDFKSIYVGRLEFSLWAPEGAMIDVYGFENMYQGEIDYTIGLNNGIRYRCKDGWQTYGCMTRMGLRYAVITIRSCDQPVKIKDFHIRHATYAPTNYGDFQCDDYLLNRIWIMCRDTHLLCMEDSFTDCPTYEQAFWIGDAQTSAMVNSYVYGEYDFIRHNQELAATAMENTKLLNALTPTDWNTSIPIWMMNWIISVFEFVHLTEDDSTARKLYSDMKETLLYYKNFIQSDGGFLINGWNMMDWASMDIHNHGVVTGQQAVLAHCFGAMANFAKKIGYEEDYQIFLECRENLLQYIDMVLWNEDKKMYMDGWSPEHGMSKTVSIQSHILLSIYDGILDSKKKALVDSYLIYPPDEFVKVGSPFMLNYLYDALAKRGEITYILEDMKVRWGDMLQYDSTTCWEVFPGFYEVNRTRSYCHSWSTAPAYYLMKYLLGISMVGSGFKKIKIELPECHLNWCRGSMPTPFGPIRTDWSRNGECITMQIWIPKEIELEEPDLKKYKVTIHKMD